MVGYVEGFEWTVKSLFTYPNEFIYWAIQVVIYPYVTGLVAGAFVLSTVHHLFGQKDMKGLANFALVVSFALMIVVPVPLLIHLQHPLRGIEILMTPHLTSAMAAFGFVYLFYILVISSEIWFVYRKHFVEQVAALKGRRGIGNAFMKLLYTVLTLGAWDITEQAIHEDKKAVRKLAAIGIPAALFLHGYAGFIFGSIKANALWSTPMMLIIFILSAIVSGIALCMLMYIVIMSWRRYRSKTSNKPQKLPAAAYKGPDLNLMSVVSKYLLWSLFIAFTFELLNLITMGYLGLQSWGILRSVIYERDFFKIVILQYLLGELIPIIMLIMPRPTMRRITIATALILFGVFMMRWNVVIGGQSFSKSLAGYMNYVMPIIPHNIETLKEGLVGAIFVLMLPFGLFWIINKITPTLTSKSE